jgi:hypothetical protein
MPNPSQAEPSAEPILKQIETDAPRVAAEYDAHKAAIDAEREAEAAVLERAIAAARPALRAIAGVITQTYYSTSGRNGLNPVKRDAHFDERGLCIGDEYTRENDESGNRGTLGGERLYLLTDGRLAVVERDGTWSCWQGEPDQYEATMAFVSLREAMADWDLDGALQAIAEALGKQARAKATAAAQERAARLAALAQLAK